MAPEGMIQDPAGLDRIQLRTGSGKMVPLSALVSFEEVAVAPNLQRQDQRRAVPMTATLGEGTDLRQAMDRLTELAAEVLPPGMGIMFTGEAKELNQASSGVVQTFAFALLVVLLALVPVVGPNASYSADEGAAIIQASSLAGGDGWIIEHPIPEVDPSGAHYPLELSPEGPKGAAAYAKHPAYPWALAGADRLGGTSAMNSDGARSTSPTGFLRSADEIPAFRTATSADRSIGQ